MPTASPTQYCKHGQWNALESPFGAIGRSRFGAIGHYNNNIAWLLGKTQDQVVSFDVTSKTFTNHGSLLESPGVWEEDQNYAQKDDMLYFQSNVGPLFQYQLKNGSVSLQARHTRAFYPYQGSGCLTVVDDYLIIIYAFDTYIFNTITANWTGPDNTPRLITRRWQHCCQVSTAKYLYAIGGVANTTIEKLYVGDMLNINNYNWEALTDTLSIKRLDAASVVYDDFAYIIGGNNGLKFSEAQNFDVVDVLNMRSDKVFTTRSLCKPLGSAVAVVLLDEIWVFDHREGYAQYLNLLPTPSPTLAPSTNPTGTPTTSKTPYVWIDYDFVHRNDIFYNVPSERNQIAAEGDASLIEAFPTTLSLTNDKTSVVGVFECENNSEGKYSAIFLPTMTYDAFSLEVIAKVKSYNEVFPGFIIGMVETSDSTDGNVISFNSMKGQSFQAANTFFPGNTKATQKGWHATAQYSDSMTTTNPIQLDTFYHIIVSQHSDGLISVYVNGAQYGSSYLASGKKNMSEVTPTINMCGNYWNETVIGIDASIAAFGFYTESFDDEIEAQFSCIKAGLTNCDGIAKIPTAEPTASPTFSPTIQCIVRPNPDWNYLIAGHPAIATGDPHFETFNGDRHDFMGFNATQYYYIHPCRTITGIHITRDEMPFSMLGYHYQMRETSVTGLDYITLELYDNTGELYYVWLSASIASWGN
eukprot:102480_1